MEKIGKNRKNRKKSSWEIYPLINKRFLYVNINTVTTLWGFDRDIISFCFIREMSHNVETGFAGISSTHQSSLTLKSIWEIIWSNLYDLKRWLLSHLYTLYFGCNKYLFQFFISFRQINFFPFFLLLKTFILFFKFLPLNLINLV